MYLTERLIGTGLYCCCLLVVCLLIGRTKIRLKGILDLYAVMLACMGFFYQPALTGDLTRIYEMMSGYRGLPFASFYEIYAAGSPVPAARVLYWLVAQTGVNRLLPVISCLLCYGVIFRVIRESAHHLSASRVNVALTLFFVMSGSVYTSVIGGIRMMMAMALIVHCFYRESVERTFRVSHLLLYALAVMLHSMALVLVGLCALALVLDRRQPQRVRLGLGLLALAAGVCLLLWARPLLEDIYEKAWFYLADGGYSDVWEYLMGALLAVFYVVLAILECRDDGVCPEFGGCRLAMDLGIAVSLVFCLRFSIFYRFIGHWVPLLGSPVLMDALQRATERGRVRRDRVTTQKLVLAWGMMLLLLGCSRGSLSSLKFFVFNQNGG